MGTYTQIHNSLGNGLHTLSDAEAKQYFFIKDKETFSEQTRGSGEDDEHIELLRNLRVMISRLLRIEQDQTLWKLINQTERDDINEQLKSLINVLNPNNSPVSDLIENAKMCESLLDEKIHALQKQAGQLTDFQQSACNESLSFFKALYAKFRRSFFVRNRSVNLFRYFMPDNKTNHYSIIKPYKADEGSGVKEERGRIILSTKPMRTGEQDVEHDLRKKGRKVGAVISLVMPEEVSVKRGRCHQEHMDYVDWDKRGVEFMGIPIKDFDHEVQGEDVNAHDVYLSAIELVCKCIANGEDVIIHCNAGRGRSAMFVAMCNTIDYMYRNDTTWDYDRRGLTSLVRSVYTDLKEQRQSVSYSDKGSVNCCDADSTKINERVDAIVNFIDKKGDSIKKALEKHANRLYCRLV